MPCYHPLSAFQNLTTRGIFFNPYSNRAKEEGNALAWQLGNYKEVTLPCGQCIGCRLERARQWAVRCCLEASQHEDNCFITLTYNDEHLPKNNSLVKEDLTKFFKRLRKRIDKPIRYLACGEYGEQLQRPHYHAILFGVDLRNDGKKVERSLPWIHSSSSSPPFLLSSAQSGLFQKPDEPSSNLLRTSSVLDETWTNGFNTVGSFTFESASYVARYCLKKVTGKDAEEYYGERVPPYNVMSRRPGIASDWYDVFREDVETHDAVNCRGRMMKPPRYFDNKLQLTDPKKYEIVKAIREKVAKLSEKEDWETLARKEEYILHSLKQRNAE